MGLKVIKTINNLFLNIQKGILFFSSLLIAFGLGAQVVMRYFLKTDLYGIEELLVLPTIWLYFMGASYGTYMKKHISADLVSVYIKKDITRIIINLITSFITVILTLILTIWGYQFFMWSLSNGATSTIWKIPNYSHRFSIYLGFILMLIYFLAEFVKQFGMLISEIKKTKESQER